MTKTSSVFPRIGPASLLLFILGFWSSVAGAAVSLQIVVAGSAWVQEAAGTLTAEKVDNEESTGPVQFDVLIPGTASLSLAPGVWRIRLAAERFWARGYVEKITKDTALTIQAWPTGELAGTIQTEAESGAEIDSTHPEDLDYLRVSFRSSDYRALEREPEGTVACSLTKKVFTCRLPSGNLDLQLMASGCIPHFLWDLKVQPSKRIEIGRLTFHAGASIAGRVVTEGGALAVGARVVLDPFLLEAPTSARKRDQLDRLRRSTESDENGFFIFADIKPGQYVVAAEHVGFATSKATVKVTAGSHTAVDHPPLVLSPPRNLQVYLDPPSPTVTQPWLLGLYRVDRGRRVVEEIARSTVDWSGNWRSPGLADGRYRVKIGTSPEDRWYVQEIEVNPGSLSLFVSIPVIEVRGSLFHGKEPLAGTLLFGGRTGSISVSIEADEEGHFSGLLPHDGKWNLDIKNQDRGISVSLEDVEVRRRPGKSYADLELKLSSTRLTVSTVDTSGIPVQALVKIRMQDRAGTLSTKSSNSDGSIEFIGLPAGWVKVHASARRVTPSGEEGLSARPVEIRLEEDEPRNVELILRPKRKVSGRVVSGGIGISGATVHIIPLSMDSPLSSTAATDIEGRFEEELSSDVDETVVVVSAPGYSLRILGARIGEDSFNFDLESEGGTLVVRIPETIEKSFDSNRQVVVVHARGAMPLGYLFPWRQLHDSSPVEPPVISIPSMDPGEYKICFASPSEIQAGLHKTDALACEVGYLNPGGILALSPPRP